MLVHTDGKCTFFGLSNQVHSGVDSLTTYPRTRIDRGEVWAPKLVKVLGQLLIAHANTGTGQDSESIVSVE